MAHKRKKKAQWESGLLFIKRPLSISFPFLSYCQEIGLLGLPALPHRTGRWGPSMQALDQHLRNLSPRVLWQSPGQNENSLCRHLLSIMKHYSFNTLWPNGHFDEKLIMIAQARIPMTLLLGCSKPYRHPQYVCFSQGSWNHRRHTRIYSLNLFCATITDCHRLGKV